MYPHGGALGPIPSMLAPLARLPKIRKAYARPSGLVRALQDLDEGSKEASPESHMHTLFCSSIWGKVAQTSLLFVDRWTRKRLRCEMHVTVVSVMTSRFRLDIYGRDGSEIDNKCACSVPLYVKLDEESLFW